MTQQMPHSPNVDSPPSGVVLPRLVRLYIQNCLIGFGLSAAFVGSLLWFDVAGLYRLVSSTDGGMIAILMLFVFNGLVFAGVQFAVTIILMSEHDDDTGGKSQAEPVLLPIPVPAHQQEIRHRSRLRPRHDPS